MSEMNEIMVKGIQEFMGFNLPILEGGFGNNQRCMLAKTIADIHEVELKYINKLINNNVDEFEEGIDLLDLKTGDYKELVLKNELFTNAQWGNANNIYLLSEQGYMALVGFMKTDKAKEIRKQLRRNYFTMREIINSNENLKANLLLSIYNGGQEAVLATRQLTDIEVKEATAPLIKEIEIQKPKVDVYDKFISSNGLYTPTQLSKLYKIKNVNSAKSLNPILNEKGVCYKQGKSWLPYATVNKDWYKIITGEHGTQLKFTPLGIIEIAKILDVKIDEKELNDIINN